MLTHSRQDAKVQLHAQTNDHIA